MAANGSGANKKAPEGWTIRIPCGIYDAGYFRGREMFSVLQVYLCLLRFADWKTGNGRLGRSKIAEQTGIRDRETISRAFTQLRQQGLVKTWWHNTDRGFIRYYQVALDLDEIRRNAVAYLKHKGRNARDGYEAGKVHQKGAGKCRQERPSISHTIKQFFNRKGSDPPPNPFVTTALRMMENARRSSRTPKAGR